jgi:hypothetical protein
MHSIYIRNFTQFISMSFVRRVFPVFLQREILLNNDNCVSQEPVIVAKRENGVAGVLNYYSAILHWNCINMDKKYFVFL